MWLRFVLQKSPIISIAPIIISHYISKYSIKFQPDITRQRSDYRVINTDAMSHRSLVITGRYASLSCQTEDSTVASDFAATETFLNWR